MYSTIVRDKEKIKLLTGEDRIVVILQIDDQKKRAKISSSDYIKKVSIDYNFVKSII